MVSMRPAALLFLAACASRDVVPPSSMTRDLLHRARGAERRGDRRQARELLEQAHAWAPEDVEAALYLAHVTLDAFGDIERARSLFGSCLRKARHRALHGLGLCALRAGDLDRAEELLRDSMRERPTPACARDLAILLLSKGADATEALDAVENLSFASWESELLLAAAGRVPPPPSPSSDAELALARARLLAIRGDAAGALAELSAHFARAYVTPEARGQAASHLSQDFAFRGNPDLVSGVKSLEAP